MNVTYEIECREKDKKDVQIIGAVQQLVNLICPTYSEWERAIGYLRNIPFEDMLDDKEDGK
jgi:hypothetical protein